MHMGFWTKVGIAAGGLFALKLLWDGKKLSDALKSAAGTANPTNHVGGHDLPAPTSKVEVTVLDPIFEMVPKESKLGNANPSTGYFNDWVGG